MYRPNSLRLSRILPSPAAIVGNPGAYRLRATHNRREVNQVPQLLHLFYDLRNREDGQTMAEYGVVLAVITLLVIGAFMALSGGISGAINSVTSIL